MRAVIQRVSRARVTIESEVTGSIGHGLVILLGIGRDDTPAESQLLADKIAGLRIFADAQSKFNLSALDVNAQMLVISQFTLYADVRRGRRPGFTDAAPPDIAAPLVEHFMDELRRRGLTVAGGRFGAHMAVELVNDGPVTIVLDTAIWSTGAGRSRP